MNNTKNKISRTHRKIIMNISLIVISLMTIGVTSANPGFNIYVDPINVLAAPGETAEYSVTVFPIDTLTDPEFVEFMVVDNSGNMIGWNTLFSENLFLISYPTYPNGKTVNLRITVPQGTREGSYYLKVRGEGYLPDGNIPPNPDRDLGYLESSEFPIIVSAGPPAPVPELNTAMLTTTGIFGILLISRRYKK